MKTLFDMDKDSEALPRLNQCFICKEWQLEKNLSGIEVPDQAGFVRKLACQGCLEKNHKVVMVCRGTQSSVVRGLMNLKEIPGSVPVQSVNWKEKRMETIQLMKLKEILSPVRGN